MLFLYEFCLRSLIYLSLLYSSLEEAAGPWSFFSRFLCQLHLQRISEQRKKRSQWSTYPFPSPAHLFPLVWLLQSGCISHVPTSWSGRLPPWGWVLTPQQEKYFTSPMHLRARRDYLLVQKWGKLNQAFNYKWIVISFYI